MLGNFFGGLTQGALQVNQAFDQNARTKIAQDQDAREQYKFDQQKALEEGNKTISQQEADAQSNVDQYNSASDTANSPSGDQDRMTQALNENQAAQNDASIADNPDGTTGATPLSSDQQQALSDAIKNQKLSIPDKAAAVSKARAINASVDSGQADDLDSINATEAQNSPIIDSEYRGITPDPVNKLRFANMHARLLSDNGDWQGAQAIQKNAKTEAATQFMGAVMNKDANTAYQLYQEFPNGHFLKNLQFDGQGNMITTDVNGVTKTTAPMDAMIGAVANSGDPDKAAQLLVSRMATDGKLALLEQKIEQTKDIAMQNNQQKGFDAIIRAISASNRGSGNGNGGTGAGGGLEKSGELFAKDDPHYGDKVVQFDNTVNQLLTFNPNLAKDDNRLGASTAHLLAKDIVEGRAKPTIELQPDGSFNWSVRDGANNQWNLGKNVDPLSSNGSPFKDQPNGPTAVSQVAALYRKTFPQDYAQAIPVANNRSVYDNLTKIANNPSVVPEQRQEASRMVNIISSINKYGVAADPNAPQSAPQKTSGMPAIPADQANDASKVGIKSPISVGGLASAVYGAGKQAVSSVGNYIDNSVQGNFKNLIDGQREQFNKTGQYDQSEAQRIGSAALRDQRIAAMLTPDEKRYFSVAVGQQIK